MATTSIIADRGSDSLLLDKPQLDLMPDYAVYMRASGHVENIQTVKIFLLRAVLGNMGVGIR